eukprot:114700_1
MNLGIENNIINTIPGAPITTSNQSPNKTTTHDTPYFAPTPAPDRIPPIPSPVNDNNNGTDDPIQSPHDTKLDNDKQLCTLSYDTPSLNGTKDCDTLPPTASIKPPSQQTHPKNDAISTKYSDITTTSSTQDPNCKKLDAISNTTKVSVKINYASMTQHSNGKTSYSNDITNNTFKKTNSKIITTSYISVLVNF